MRRRDCLGLLGAAAAAWPLAVHAQQSERMRRIGVLINLKQGDPEATPRLTAFQNGLRSLGWIEGSNLRIDYRWGASDGDRLRTYASELVSLKPDLIVAQSASGLAAVRQATSVIPIIFVQLSDPVGSGFVPSIVRPGGNISGFTTFEFSIGGKWLGLLKELVPYVTRVALIQNIKSPNWISWLQSIEPVAPSLGLRLVRAGVLNDTELDAVINDFAREPNGAMIALPDPFLTRRRDSFVELAARQNLPTIYPFRYWTAAGGLISYGIDLPDLYRRTASYVDLVLRGASPGDLPIQQPTKYELVINLKTAKALGLTVPPTLLARADEVIE